MKSSPQEKPYQRPTQALKVNSELSYIPAKLLGFSSPRVQHPLLPSLSSKPNIQPSSERKIRQKKSESPTITQDEHAHLGLIRHAHHNSLSKLADDFLKVDKQSHAKPDLLRASKDVSYLLETNKFKQQKTVNEFFNKTITQSVHLLSPEKQNAFLSKTLYRPDPTTTEQTQAQRIESPSLFAQSRMSDHHKSHDTLRLPTSLGKLRNFITTEEEDYIPPKSARLTAQTARTKSNFQTPRTRSPNKIVDSVAVGLGPNNDIELDQNEVKEGLKKVKEKTIVEHRSQNMKLAIPSGRKEVIALSGWLNNMLEGIYKEDEIKTEKVFEDVQLIYTACLQEIIRQVKVQCGERGQLLEKIWEAYIDIFDKVIRENAKVRREIEKEHLQEMEEVSKVYQKRLDLMEYEMNLVKKDRTEVKETLEKRKEEVAYLKKKVEKQDGQLMSHKDLVEEVRDEMDRVKNENAELRRLVLESEVQIQKRYIEVQQNISERYEIKRAEAHKRKASEPDRLKNRIFDPMREKNLNENLNMMDKLDDVIEGFAIRDQEDQEDRSPRGLIEEGEKSEEDLFKEIGVDTDDLEVEVVVPEPEVIEKMDQEVQCDIEIIVEIVPVVVVQEEIIENKEEEEIVTKEKTSSSDDSDSSDDSSDSSSGDGSSSKKSKKSKKSKESKENEENEEDNIKMEEMMKELGKKRIYDKINKLTKSESYKILNNVERKLYEKVSQEEDGDMKTNLINVLGMMIRQEIGLENEDYQDLVTKVVEKNMERAEPPSEDLAEVLEAIKEMSKDELLEVLGLLQKRWHKEGEGKVKEVKEPDDLMRFMVEILKGSETVEIKNKELGGLLLKVRQLQSKRQERLNFMDTMEEEAQKTAREATDEAEKVNFLEEMKRRLNGTIGAVGINGLNRELVNILDRNVSDRGDLAEKDLKELLNNALGALDKTLVQITALKVENQEQNIDIQELNEVKETKDQQVARLEKELQEYKNRAKFAERESDKMSRKLFKIQSTFEEKNKMKMAKLASVMQNMSRFRDMYRGRASFAHPIAESFAESPLIKRPTISVTDYDNGGENDAKAASLVITSYSEQPESPTIRENVDYTEKIIENIESLISDDEKGIEEIDEEENWSENEGVKEDEEEIKKKKFEQEITHGSNVDIKIFKNLGKKIVGKVAKQGEMNKASKISRILSVNADSAIALLARAKEKKDLKASLPKLTVLKFISQIYIERLKVSGTLREMPLYIVTYDYFINKYGLKRVAESKCQQMFESILSYKENRRIARFKDLLGLGEGLESGELELYFSTFKHFDPLGNGTIIASNIQEKTLILFEYAELAAASLFEKKIDPQNMKLLISKLNQSKISDNKGGKAMIEFEDAVDEFLSVERGLQDKVKGYVKDVFNAADLDNDEIIMFSEFDILYKQLEKERYNKDKVKKLFFEQADFILPDGSSNDSFGQLFLCLKDERVVSFNKFARICLETGLFSKDKQVNFAKISDPADKIQTVQDLEENLKGRLNEIRLRFMKCNSYNIQIKGAVTTLYNSIRNPLKPRNIVWLTYRLLDEESKTQLLSYEIKKMLPKELQIIQKFVEDYEDWS